MLIDTAGKTLIHRKSKNKNVSPRVTSARCVVTEDGDGE